MVKKSSIRNFLLNCACAAVNSVLTVILTVLTVNSYGNGENPAKFLDICILKLLMHYFNKRLKPTTACVNNIRTKNTSGTGIEQINCRFVGAMFVFLQSLCARCFASARARAKQLWSATLKRYPLVKCYLKRISWTLILFNCHLPFLVKLLLQ